MGVARKHLYLCASVSAPASRWSTLATTAPSPDSCDKVYPNDTSKPLWGVETSEGKRTVSYDVATVSSIPSLMLNNALVTLLLIVTKIAIRFKSMTWPPRLAAEDADTGQVVSRANVEVHQRVTTGGTSSRASSCCSGLQW